MPAHGPCPSCGGQLVELERSGVRIDACRRCRGVFLDRGELETILERERQHLQHAEHDDEEFFREVTGRGAHGHAPQHHHGSPGFDQRTAERLFQDFMAHKKRKKSHKRKGLLEELLG